MTSEKRIEYRKQFEGLHIAKRRTREEELELEEDATLLMCELLNLHVSTAGKVSEYNEDLHKRVNTNEVTVEIDISKAKNLFVDDKHIHIVLNVTDQQISEVDAMWDDVYLDKLASDCEGDY